MEEIKVGDYVRTEKGTIAKIEDVEWDILYGIVDMKPKYKHWINEKQCYTEYIVKHSPNIIDLIEVGDIVNYTFWEEPDDFTIFCEMIRNVEQLLDFKFDIKENNITFNSIITKEQFNQVKYEV